MGIGVSAGAGAGVRAAAGVEAAGGRGTTGGIGVGGAAGLAAVGEVRGEAAESLDLGEGSLSKKLSVEPTMGEPDAASTASSAGPAVTTGLTRAAPRLAVATEGGALGEVVPDVALQTFPPLDALIASVARDEAARPARPTGVAPPRGAPAARTAS